MNPINEFAGQENLLRAYEICLAGKFKMKLFSDEKDKDNGVNKTQIDIYSKKLLVTTTVVEEAHLLIEIVRSSIDSLLSKRKQETLNDIADRVNKYSNVTVSSELCDSSHALLKVAYERLGLMPYEVKMIIEMATVIARIDGETTIKPQHTAEAIQYRSIDKETFNIK